MGELGGDFGRLREQLLLRELVDAPVRDAGKEQQRLVVSQLPDQLAAFRAARGVEAPSAPGEK